MREESLGRGQHIAGFDSLEEMLAYMRDQEREANEAVLPEQWKITWGDHVFRLVDDLAIFGYVYTPNQFLRSNLRAGEDLPDPEIVEELESIKHAFERGYRYGKWYSEIEPMGEYGSAHVVSLWPITVEEFEECERNDWKVTPAIAFRVAREVLAARKREGKE